MDDNTEYVEFLKEMKMREIEEINLKIGISLINLSFSEILTDLDKELKEINEKITKFKIKNKNGGVIYG